MPAVVPNLWFDTRAVEAAEFYVSVFPDSRILDVLHYGPGTGDREGTVVTVDFELDGQRFTGINGGPQFTFDEAVSFLIPCADQAEVDRYWDALSADGGKEGPCGWLTDRFGLSWQVAPTRLDELLRDPDPARAERATAAMMTMTKLDVAELERAADGTA